MCALLIMGLISSLAYPVFTRSLARSRLNADAVKLAAVLRNARQGAICEGSKKIVTFYPYCAQYRDVSGGKVYHLNTGIEYYGDTTFNPISGLGTRGCVFAPSGAPGGGGTVKLRNQYNDVLYVIVSAVAGRVRISDKDSNT